MLLTKRTINARILENTAELAEAFSRQRRSHLDPADFERLRETSYLLTKI
jgi:hypothetical protein